MHRERTLAKNTAIVAIGQICTKFISFFLLPLYTAVLTAKEYGTVDLFNTYISLLLPIVFFQIDQAVFRFLIDIRKNEQKKKVYLSTSTFFVLFQTILYIFVYLIISIFIKSKYKYFLASNVVVAMFSNFVLQVSRGLGDNATYSKGSLITGTGTIILNVLFIAVLKMGASGMLLGVLLANAICAIYVFFKKKLYTYISLSSFDIKTLKELLAYSFPLIPNQLSWWIVNVSDRTIVSIILGVTMNGIYSAANKFSSICVTFYNIFSLTWTESAALHFNDSDSTQYFSNILNTILKLFSSMCFFVISIMPFAFKFFIKGAEYNSAYFQIPILMIATLFTILVSFLGSVYISLKKSGEIAKTSIYAAIINILINIFLIKIIGLYAASISTLISYMSMTIYRYIDVQKYLKIQIEKKFIFFSTIVCCFITFTYYLNNFILNIVSLVLIFIYSFNYCHSLILKIFVVLKQKIIKKIL